MSRQVYLESSISYGCVAGLGLMPKWPSTRVAQLISSVLLCWLKPYMNASAMTCLPCSTMLVEVPLPPDASTLAAPSYSPMISSTESASARADPRCQIEVL